MEITHKVYAVYDKVSGSFPLIFQSQSDGLACRSALSTMRFPIRDTSLYHLGDIYVIIDDLSSVNIDFDSSVTVDWLNVPRLVDWTSYKFPETPAEALAPLGLSPEEVVEISKAKINAVALKEDK